MQFAAYLRDSTGKVERREVDAKDEQTARAQLEKAGSMIVELRELPPVDEVQHLVDGWKTTCVVLSMTTFGLGVFTAGAMMFIRVHPPVMMLFFGWMLLGIGFAGLANQRSMLKELRRKRS